MIKMEMGSKRKEFRNPVELGIDDDKSIQGLGLVVWVVGLGGLNVMRLDRFVSGVLSPRRLWVIFSDRTRSVEGGTDDSAFGQLLRKMQVRKRRNGTREQGLPSRTGVDQMKIGK
jgi:hypothetical protein